MYFGKLVKLQECESLHKIIQKFILALYKRETNPTIIQQINSSKTLINDYYYIQRLKMLLPLIMLLFCTALVKQYVTTANVGTDLLNSEDYISLSNELRDHDYASLSDHFQK